MIKPYLDLEKDPYHKELIIGFEKPCTIKKTYGDLWDKNEIKREKELFNIQSNFIYHPLPSFNNSSEIKFYAPFFLTLRRLLDNDFQTNHELFKKYQYSWILQGANALSDIHSNELYHGNLSNESFYVDEKLIIRIGNIGYRSTKYSSRTHQYYMPPEGFSSDFNINVLPLFKQQQYDVYSFGIIMLNILTLQSYENSLYDKPDIRLEKKNYKVFKKIADAQLKELNGIEPEFTEIIRLCLDSDPNKRIKSDSLFEDIHKIIEEKKDLYAINSLSVVHQPLNVFEAMKIIPQNIPLNLQITKELYESCTYENVLQVILSHPKLIEILDSSIPGPLISYTLYKKQFDIRYENSNFITVSKDKYFKDHPHCWLFSVTLHELLYEYNFIPNISDFMSWFYNIQFYILNFIANKVPVCNISLNSIFVTFGVDRAQLFLFPISEDETEEELNLINWLIQLGNIMNEINQYYQSKMSELNQNAQNSQEIKDIMEIEDIDDISHVQSLIVACLSLNELLENDDDPNNNEIFDKIVHKIFNLLFNSYEKNKEIIELNRDQEILNIFNIFARLNHFLSLPTEDRFKDCTQNDVELMKSLIYALLNCIVPDECQIGDMDEIINPFNILRIFYDILYHYEVKPFASKEISRIDESIRRIKRENPIVHKFDLTGLQVHLFRQFMISTVPKIFINDNNHELILTVNNDDDDDESNIFITLQNIIDFAEESNIEFDKIDDHTVSLHYYIY